jgi:hypothetical protein
MGILASKGLHSMMLVKAGNLEDNFEIVAGTNQNVHRCAATLSCVVIYTAE